MNAELLLEHFHRLGDAPDAVPRLRRFILDLAVRGKLVEQNAADQPAVELLKEIKADILAKSQSRRIKDWDDLGDVGADEMSFECPESWCWTRLAFVSMCLDHMREPVNSSEREKRIEGKGEVQLYPYYGATQQQGLIDDYIFDEELVLLGEDGVPFFDDLRPKAYLIRGKSWVNNHAHVFRVVKASSTFVLYWLNTFDYAGRVAGATRGKLNKSKALDIPVPIPPLPEQHRIVAKVEELMALCDGLEAALREGEELKAKALEAVLHVEATPSAPARPAARAYTVPQAPLPLAAEPATRRRGRPRKTEVAQDGAATHAILAFLQAHPGLHGKAAILAATGIDAAAWNAAIKALLEAGSVVREGEKKGARYRAR